MPDSLLLKYMDWALYFAMLILALVVLARIAEVHGEYKQSVLAVESKPEKPDLMEQAIANIAMRKMQLQLRELLVYGEPTEMHELLREYMRLKEAEGKEETQ